MTTYTALLTFHQNQIMSPFRCTPFSSDSKWTPGRRKRKLTSRKGHRQQAPSSPMDLPKASCYINWKSQNCSLFFPPSPGTHFSAKLSVQSEYFLSLDVMPVSSLFLYDFMILTLTLQSLPRCKRNSFYNKNFYNCVRNSKKKTPQGYLVLACVSLVETVSCLWMKQMRQFAL